LAELGLASSSLANWVLCTIADFWEFSKKFAPILAKLKTKKRKTGRPFHSESESKSELNCNPLQEADLRPPELKNCS
jgi:hypothetical protein